MKYMIRQGPTGHPYVVGYRPHDNKFIWSCGEDGTLFGCDATHWADTEELAAAQCYSHVALHCSMLFN